MASDNKTKTRLVTGIVSILVILMTLAGINYGLTWLNRMPAVKIQVIGNKGELKHVSQEAIQQKAKAIHGNFFKADMKIVQAKFQEIPWVRSASVRRIWPDTLEVTLEEHEPFARWGTDDLLNTHDEIFHVTYKADLPRFVGPEGSEKEIAQTYRKFTTSLQAINMQPKEIRLSARRAWQVKLSDGMLLELGRTDIHERLNRFIAVTKAVPDMQGRKGRVDLRYSNGFAVKFTSPSLVKAISDHEHSN